MSNFPTTLDDDTSLHLVADGVDAITAAHHNDLKDAIKAVEAKVGIYNTGTPTSLDYRLGHPTSGHSHNGASGQGAPLSPSAILSAIPPLRYPVVWTYPGSVPSGASLGAPLSFGKTMWVESVHVAARRSPSGATAAFDINFGPTSLWAASQGNRPILPAGSALYQNASPNFVTYPSGALITIDADKVGTNEPGSDISITFIFRD
jgi:hypothetical protein